MQRPSRTKSLAEAKQQYIAITTALRQLELRQKESELISRAAVEAEWFTIARTMIDNLANVASRCAGLVAAEKSQDRCYAILSAEIHHTLEGLTRDA